jgi:glyoxylase-like metal-dependent hydrolase (beta-lactamase superfamily II)
MSGDQFDREKDIEYIKLTKRTLAVTSKMGFIAGAISLDNFIVVIDSTLFPFTARLLRKHINEVFKLPVRFLFLTHYHGDHFWGVAAFNDVIITGSKPLIRNIIDEREIQPARFKEWKKEDPKKAQLINEIDTSLLPNITFTNGIEIRDEELFVELYHCGGHTSCSSYAYFPHDKVLFAGDLIFAKEWPWAGDPTCNPGKWINALDEILKLDIDKVIPGHGPITCKEEVEVQLNFLKRLKEETIIVLEQKKGIESIKIPPFYKDKTPGEWVRKDTLKCFYNFYNKQLL